MAKRGIYGTGHYGFPPVVPFRDVLRGGASRGGMRFLLRLGAQGMEMIRSELVQALAKSHPGLSPRELDNIVTVFFDEVVQHLCKGGRVELRGFGTFSARSRNSRNGRNPRTGEIVLVSAKAVPHFKPGKEILARIND
jgi:integration host factor subunit beta